MRVSEAWGVGPDGPLHPTAQTSALMPNVVGTGRRFSIFVSCLFNPIRSPRGSWPPPSELAKNSATQAETAISLKGFLHARPQERISLHHVTHACTQTRNGSYIHLLMTLLLFLSPPYLFNKHPVGSLTCRVLLRSAPVSKEKQGPCPSRLPVPGGVDNKQMIRNACKVDFKCCKIVYRKIEQVGLVVLNWEDVAPRARLKMFGDIFGSR